MENEQDQKSEFSCPDQYITRRVGPLGLAQWGRSALNYHGEQIKPLYELLMEKDQIVLIGEAGFGKSWELRHLAFRIEQGGWASPVFVPLKDYVDETIEQLATGDSETGNRQKQVIIFDGYDEIEGQNLNQFAKRLNRFVKKHPKQKIVISTRNNFYKNALDEMRSGTFEGFYECALCPLQDSDIRTYLEQEQIEYIPFRKEIAARNLTEQIHSAFFFTHIARLFKRTGRLPKIADLMDELISAAFEWDQEKYVTTQDIEERRVEIIKTLEILAFSMQCMKKTSLSAEEYQKLASQEERNIMKYCGIWRKAGAGQWEFEHNNFREYLAAKFLNHLALRSIVQAVTYGANTGRIKASWVNVLSFSVMLGSNQELFEWIVKTEPAIVIGFEASRLSDEVRTEIFCSILEQYKDKNVWISAIWNRIEDLAAFGQTEAGIDYLIEEIRCPAYFCPQYNAITLLGEMEDYLGKAGEVREVLLECCLSKETRSCEAAAAITALTNQALYGKGDGKEERKQFLQYFADVQDSHIRRALYDYILAHELQDEMLEFVLDDLKGIKFWHENSYDRLRGIEDIILSVRTCESVEKVFQFILEAEEFHSVAELLKHVLAGLFEQAEQYYKNGREEILSLVQRLFIQSSNHSEKALMRMTKEFLSDIGQVFATYEMVLQMADEMEKYYILEDLMDEQCMDDFAEKYRNHQLADQTLFAAFVRKGRKGSYRYDEFVKLVWEVDGIEIVGPDPDKYQCLRREGKQKYFDALFDQAAYQSLLDGLAELCSGKETNYEELAELKYARAGLSYELEKVMWAVLGEKPEHTKIEDFLADRDWEEFSMGEIQRELKNETEITASGPQMDWIKAYCLKTVHQIDFDKEIIYRKDGSTTVSARVRRCVFFAKYLGVDYPKEILLDLLLVPLHLADDTEHELVFDEYLTQRLDSGDIRQQVCKNLRNGKVKGVLAKLYLNYCKKYKMEEAFSLADSIVKDSDYAEFLRREALDYICETRDYEEVIERYLQDSDTVLLRLLASRFAEYKDERLIQRMILENQKSTDGMAFLRKLIESESGYGLERYYKLAEKFHAVPDYNQGVLGITKAIEMISDVKNLDQIIKLVFLQFQDGFQDKQYFGLYNSTYKAIKNIAQNHPLPVMDCLKHKKEEAYENPELRSYFSSLLLDIETDYYSRQDRAWTIAEVKNFCKGCTKPAESEEIRLKGREKLLKDLMAACISLQAASYYYGASENQRNDKIRDLLKMSGYDVKDQTRRGRSPAGKGAGEIDLMIEEEGLPVTIIEALNLDCLNTSYLDQHIDKIYDYDTTGNAFNIILAYVTVSDFGVFCKKYCSHIKNCNYRWPLISINKNVTVNDFQYSEIRIIKAVHCRNDYETALYHFCVSIGKR